MSVDLIPAIKILERAQGHITFGFRAAAGDCDSGNEGLFFFSCSRRHTRFDCDWSTDVCSSDLPAKSMYVLPSVSSMRAPSARATTRGGVETPAATYLARAFRSSPVALRSWVAIDRVYSRPGGDRKSVV